MILKLINPTKIVRIYFLVFWLAIDKKEDFL